MCVQELRGAWLSNALHYLRSTPMGVYWVRKMAQPATVINRDVLHNTVEGKPGYASTVTFSPSDISRELSSGIQSVIGRNSSKGDISHVLNSGYVSMQEGNPHSTTSLQRAIAGTARQLNLSMAVWVSAAKDPLKLCLGTEIMNEEKLIITRQYVAGGGAQLTAERAPARLISIKEDQREARVERYGVDIEVRYFEHAFEFVCLHFPCFNFVVCVVVSVEQVVRPKTKAIVGGCTRILTMCFFGGRCRSTRS